MFKAKSYILLFAILLTSSAQAELSLLQELQFASSVGWRSADLLFSQRQEPLQGQAYRLSFYTSLFSRYLFAGASIDRSNLFSADAKQTFISTEPSLSLKAGFNPRLDWRVDLIYRHLLAANIKLIDHDVSTSQAKIVGGRFGFCTEWTGMMGLGILAGAEYAANNLKLSDTSDDRLKIKNDREFYLGGLVRF